jgi:hypothetical protein
MPTRAYLGLIGREGNKADPACLVDVARNRLQRGSPGLAVGAEPAGGVRNYSVRQDKVRPVSDEEFRRPDGRRMKMRNRSRQDHFAMLYGLQQVLQIESLDIDW